MICNSACPPSLDAAHPPCQACGRTDTCTLAACCDSRPIVLLFLSLSASAADIVVTLQKFDEKYPKVGMLAEEETEDQVP